jgi:beta-lactamase regulating signal transducer with metallopeptidase domain
LASTGAALLATLVTFGTHQMHSPPAGIDHALWLLWIVAAMIVTTVVAGVARFVQLRRATRSPG